MITYKAKLKLLDELISNALLAVEAGYNVKKDVDILKDIKEDIYRLKDLED